MVMKNSRKQITDVSGRILKVGDPVFILDIPDPKLETSIIVSSLSMGQVVFAEDKDEILIKIESDTFSCPANKLSRMPLDEDIDNIIIHVSHDIETLKLQKESKILNNMLNIEEK
jgi:hypothetical protein